MKLVGRIEDQGQKIQLVELRIVKKFDHAQLEHAFAILDDTAVDIGPEKRNDAKMNTWCV